MTLLMIVLAGLAGSAILIRTGQFYWGVDNVAFTVVCLMAFALFWGVVELLRAARRTQGLASELEGLTKTPSLEGIEGASPLLRALLQARLDRVPLGVPRASFTPYLIGLLVMLGLLGTFMGLFETLRGARQALTASGDVEALRAGLSTPMGGLMRSFGTSAAGVCASAMLGLAAVFCRREAGELGVRLHAAASGPFAKYASAHRQLVALEQLARQGEAFPAAADSLALAAERLESLRDDWSAAHQGATERVAKKLDEATGLVQRAIGSGIEDAARASKEAIAPLLADAVSGTVQAAADHLERLEAAADAERNARRDAEAAAGADMKARFEALLDRMKADEGARTERHDALLSALETREGQIADERRAALEALLGEHRAAANEVAKERDAAAEAHRESLASIVQAQREAAEQARARDERVAEAHRESLAQLLGAQREAAAQAAEREDARLAETRGNVASLLEAQREASERADARDGARLEAIEAQLAGAVERLAADHAERTTSLMARVDAVQRAVAENIEAAAERDADRAAALSGAATTLREDLAAAAEVMRERLAVSAEADAQRAQQAQQLFESLQEASGRIGEAAGTQASALEQFVASTEGRTHAMEERSQQRLDALLDRVGAAVEAQAARLTALEEQLAARQKADAEALAERLTDHAARLGDGLKETVDVVQEAAGLVHAGGAELTAVAEMFSAAVDKQRLAAREWLDNLGHVERAIADVGEGAAADALGQHLARTHEIFDRQLRFQQELFEQLRARREPAGDDRGGRCICLKKRSSTSATGPTSGPRSAT